MFLANYIFRMFQRFPGFLEITLINNTFLCFQTFYIEFNIYLLIFSNFIAFMKFLNIFSLWDFSRASVQINSIIQRLDLLQSFIKQIQIILPFLPLIQALLLNLLQILLKQFDEFFLIFIVRVRILYRIPLISIRMNFSLARLPLLRKRTIIVYIYFNVF